jgi:Ethanolamine utilization protein EutJ (predicted chaperonin)
LKKGTAAGCNLCAARKEGRRAPGTPLKVGVDLGTASIVIVVLDG